MNRVNVPIPAVQGYTPLAIIGANGYIGGNAVSVGGFYLNSNKTAAQLDINSSITYASGQAGCSVLYIKDI